MATTIREMASKLNIPPKKLLSEFSKKFPEQAWVLDSEVPEGFEEAVSSHAHEYAEASGVELPKGELTNIPDAVKDNQLILDSIEYGVLEAIAQIRSAYLAETAQIEAMGDIQDFESIYNSVWESHLIKKAQDAQFQAKALAARSLAKTTQLNSDLGKRQGELIRLQEHLNQVQSESETQIQQILDALLK